MPAVENFSVPAGDDFTLEVTVDAPEGSTLAGATVRWSLSQQESGAPKGEPLIEKSSDGHGIEILDAVARTFAVALDAADTAELSGLYYHEAEVTDALGKKSTVTTGLVTINRTLIT